MARLLILEPSKKVRYRRNSHNSLNVLMQLSSIRDETKYPVPGDEILSINSKPLHGMTHAEAIAEFKSVKAGDVVLHVGRRVNRKKRDSLTLPPAGPTPRQQVKWIVDLLLSHSVWKYYVSVSYLSASNARERRIPTFPRTIAYVCEDIFLLSATVNDVSGSALTLRNNEPISFFIIFW